MWHFEYQWTLTARHANAANFQRVDFATVRGAFCSHYFTYWDV
jgi:hypothetical protein